MSGSSALEGKRAVVFGAGGSIGAAAAKELAFEGAEVFLAGRNPAGIERVAREIESAGGRAHCDVVDALDGAAVGDYVDSIVRKFGSLDIEFNATGPRAAEYGGGKMAVDLTVKEFATALNTVLQSQFITAQAVARHMLQQRSGVIIFLTGSPAKPHTPGATAIGAAFGGVENMTRSLALELSGSGVRVVCVRTAANPDSRTMQDVTEMMGQAMNITAAEARAGLAEMTLLKASPTTLDTAKAAAFLASDRAHMMTGTVLNASAGATPD